MLRLKCSAVVSTGEAVGRAVYRNVRTPGWTWIVPTHAGERERVAASRRGVPVMFHPSGNTHFVALDQASGSHSRAADLPSAATVLASVSPSNRATIRFLG